MKAQIKAAAEHFLRSSGASRVARLRYRGEVLVLAYHNVLPDGAEATGETALHLPRQRFSEQLDLLSETHDVVPLASILGPMPGRRSRPRAVITFDDAYQGAMTAGVAELVRRGMAATIFVAPAFVGGRSFWWDCLAGTGDGALPSDLRQRLLDEMRGEDETIRLWAEAQGRPLATQARHNCAASEAELQSALGQGDITLASHTWSHPNLARLSREELRREMTRSRQWLEERFEGVLPWISYPYGFSSALVEEEARRAGYRAGLRVHGGWMIGRPRNDFALPRMNVTSGLSAPGFVLRTSGLIRGL